jgi:MFS family permease
MHRSLRAVYAGTFTLRFSTGLTGGLLSFYLTELPRHGGIEVDAVAVGLFSALFFTAELILAPPFGLLSDRLGHHRVMQFGPVFGGLAVILTWLTTSLPIIGSTRLLEGASTAASVPSILGFIAVSTAGDELERGRAAARFEGATLAGLGAGLAAAGLVYHALGRGGFLLNAVIYLVSYLIYRYGVSEAEPLAAASGSSATDATPVRARPRGFRRYVEILRSSHVWLLAPTWIAINASLGLWTTQSIFQLVKQPKPQFADQWLMGRADPMQVSLGIFVGLIVFFAGLAFWGERFRRYRRTSIIFFGVLGGAGLIVAAGLVNHSTVLPVPIRALEGVGAAVSLFVLAGATPAALGLLADVSEGFPTDRGAIMGLYSVFLAIGQIIGSLIGGAAADLHGIDGMLVATLILLAIAMVPLSRLRSFEYRLSSGPDIVPGREPRHPIGEP